MRVAVGMSGGIDSTVTALLLRDAGYDVFGVSMVSWRRSLCCSFEDVTRAKVVCRRLGLKHYLIDLMEAFRSEVVNPYVDARLRGETPNPCITCNQGFKFGRLWDALQLRAPADKLATGHYVRMLGNVTDKRLGLAMAHDRSKDQSYMLWQLNQAQLQRSLFPLAEMTKQQVWERASEAGLLPGSRRESQDLCFVVPDSQTFWQEQAAGRFAPGDIVSESGQVLGQHQGLVFYTPGQRRGLGVAAPQRLYVQSVEASRNQLIVAEQALQVQSVFLQDLNWGWLPDQTEPLDCLVKLRLHGKNLPARLFAEGHGQARVELQEPQEAVAVGQSVVCYDASGHVLAGGVVCQAPSL